MKKPVTLLTVMLLFASLAYSQIEKGSITLGGAFSLDGNSEKRKDGSYTSNAISLVVKPEVGFAPAKNVVIGFVPGFNFYHRKYKLSNSGLPENYFSNSYGIEPGVFARMYKVFKPGIGFYGQLSTSFSMTWSHTKMRGLFPSEVNGFYGYGYNVGINPGFVWFPTSKIALHVAYGYLGYALGLPTDGSYEIIAVNHTFNANFNLSSLRVGVQFTFPPKPKAKAE